ncbi:MAG: DUF2339 domain-containing protein [Candidatus Obscuribacterales bacterium]|nr:DUF2339 domain-containing protein [Steroidobacteraceae bacterium]
MTVVLALLGLLAGAAFNGSSGAIGGLIVGALCGEVMALKERMRKLERAITQAPQVRQGIASSAAAQASEELRETVTPERSAPTRATTPPPVVPPLRTNEANDFPIVRWLRDFFTGGNAVVRISIIVLFFGVAFLLQYAAEHNRLPIELRLFGAVVLAITFLIVGWRLRQRRSGFALALQGGASGVLYLVIFAAMRLYGVLPPTMAFGFLLAIVVLSAVLAVLQDSVWLAVLGIGGGFLAPILASSGQGNHVMLFSFYAVLNLGILGIAWYKSWRALNVLGFVFTFVIGAMWGASRYQPELFASTEPFLVLFFLFYVTLAVLFASRQTPELKGYVDGTLVFGVPVTAFALQSAMLHEQPYALSLSAVLVATLYLCLAWVLWRRRESWRLLVEAFIALSVTFATLAIPLALNGRWSAATWALEGAALIWVGSRQSRLLPRVAGALLQFAAACMLWRDEQYLFDGLPLLNSTFLGAAMVAAAGVFSSRLLYQYTERLHRIERPFAAIAFWWGWLWWLLVGLGEIDHHAFITFDTRAALLFVVLSCALASWLNRRMTIPTARWAALSLLPALLFFAAIDGVNVAHPAAKFGWVVWPVAWSAWYWVLARHEGLSQTRVAVTMHVFGYWLLVTLLSWEAGWMIDYAVVGADAWRLIAWAVVPAFALASGALLERTFSWPFATHATAYIKFASSGLAAYLLSWSLTLAVSHTAAAYPLPYLPLMNPIDLAQAFVLMAVLMWWRRYVSVVPSSPQSLTSERAWMVLGAVTFVWLNAVLLRTLHHWVGVPYKLTFLWNSTVVQAALSIFWTLLALALVWTAARRHWRTVWFVGAGLLAVELLKLFFVDLSNSGSVARIVSFMGVGVLGVLIGYVSPLPPEQKELKA